MKNNTVLVYGGSGAQGSAITCALVARGHAVHAVTRSEKNEKQIKENAATPVYASFEDLTSLIKVNNGCDAIVLTLPLVFDVDTVMGWADNVIQAALVAKIKCFVFNASGPVPEEKTGVAALDIKRLVAEKLSKSGLPVITIQPTLYMGNLAAPWTAPAIVAQGTLAYPLPETQKVSWISWDSMAEFVAAAVERPELAGNSYRAGGPEAISGSDMADVYSRYLSKPVSYYPVNLKDFENGLNQALGKPVGTEIARLYSWFSGDGAATLDVDNTEISQVLGVSPINFNEWVGTVDWQCLAKNQLA